MRKIIATRCDICTYVFIRTYKRRTMGTVVSIGSVADAYSARTIYVSKHVPCKAPLTMTRDNNKNDNFREYSDQYTLHGSCEQRNTCFACGYVFARHGFPQGIINDNYYDWTRVNCIQYYCNSVYLAYSVGCDQKLHIAYNVCIACIIFILFQRPKVAYHITFFRSDIYYSLETGY